MSWMSKTRASRPSRSAGAGFFLEPYRLTIGRPVFASLPSGTAASTSPRIPCSGTEEPDQLHLRRLEEDVDRRPAVARLARLVRDQPHALAAERREPILDQHVDTAPHTAVVASAAAGEAALEPAGGAMVTHGAHRRSPPRPAWRPRHAAASGRGLLAVGVKTAGQEDDERLGLGVDPQAGPGEPGVAQALRTEQVAPRGEL